MAALHSDHCTGSAVCIPLLSGHPQQWGWVGGSQGEDLLFIMMQFIATYSVYYN